MYFLRKEFFKKYFWNVFFERAIFLKKVLKCNIWGSIFLKKNLKGIFWGADFKNILRNA